MDSIWTLYGLYMDSIWTLYGLYMDSIWTLYGLHMDYTYMDSIWSLYVADEHRISEWHEIEQGGEQQKKKSHRNLFKSLMAQNFCSNDHVPRRRAQWGK
jgi:hypothetical protein